MSDDPESALRTQLRELGRAPGSDAFTIPWNGVAIAVSIITGSSSSISFSVKYDDAARGQGRRNYRGPATLRAVRPRRIELLVEEATHREHKNEGVSVEFQTGAHAFDEKVYIDTPTPPEVLVHVLNPEVRDAVMRLFAFNM